MEPEVKVSVKNVTRESEDAVAASAEMRRQLSTKKLRDAMVSRGWDEAMLAAHAGVSKLTVEDLLSGKSGGQARTLLKLADALGIEDMNSLFDRLE